MLAVFVPAVAVTVAVRLLKSDAPLDKVTAAFPLASDVPVAELRTPLVVANVTVTPARAALDTSVTVAVSVAVVELSVLIELVDVPKASSVTFAAAAAAAAAAGSVTTVVAGFVETPDPPPPPQPAISMIDAASKNEVQSLIVLLLEKKLST
jgi:hypothetical protein